MYPLGAVRGGGDDFWVFKNVSIRFWILLVDREGSKEERKI